MMKPHNDAFLRDIPILKWHVTNPQEWIACNKVSSCNFCILKYLISLNKNLEKILCSRTVPACPEYCFSPCTYYTMAGSMPGHQAFASLGLRLPDLSLLAKAQQAICLASAALLSASLCEFALCAVRAYRTHLSQPIMPMVTGRRSLSTKTQPSASPRTPWDSDVSPGPW